MNYATVALLLLAGCDAVDHDESAAVPATARVVAPVTARAPLGERAGGYAATAAPEAAAPTRAPVAARVLAVDGEGLRLIDPDSGSALPLAFGLPRSEVMAPLEKLRGDAATGRNADCGADYANWPDGLSLVFRGGKFAGWSLDRRAQGTIGTMSGVGPGTARADLESAYTATVRSSTLGTEFSAGGLAGLLSGPGADARVTDLWAGSICLAR